MENSIIFIFLLTVPLATVGRQIYTWCEDRFKQRLNSLYTMIRDMFTLWLKTCFHHCSGHVYIMVEDMFTTYLQGI